jgi:hypothetical protein
MHAVENIDSSTYVLRWSTAISLLNIAKTQLDYGTGRLADRLQFAGAGYICCAFLAEIDRKYHASFGQKFLNAASQFMQELAC